MMTRAQTETRTRRRIREAVESRGHSLASLDWEPAYHAGEMMGMGGGWTGCTVRDFLPITTPGNEFGGLNVDECLADIDRWIEPPGPCSCERPPFFSPVNPLRGYPLGVGMHDAGCRWHIAYRLRWWD